MKSEFVASREFVRGAARLGDLVYVLSKGKALVRQEIAHTSVVCVYQDHWADAVDTDWDSTAIAVARLPAVKMIAVSENGDVATYVGGKSTGEKIKPDPALIRNARTIEGHVYACGMKRQVYRRATERKWVDVSAPFSDSTPEVGFESLDGFSSKEIYAVGWKGEIWQFDGKTWTPQKSPTQRILTAVCCAANGVVYAAGQKGTLIQGRNDAWKKVTLKKEASDDLWDLCWFQDRLYIATLSGLYTLEGNALAPVDFGKIKKTTCYSLTTTEGVLWSIGQNDVMSFDGTRWQRYD